MTYYIYDKFGRYNNSIEVVSEDIIPMRSTQVPPTILDNTSIFNISTNTWSTFVPAQPSLDDLLMQAKIKATDLINQACSNSITSGFISSALGSNHYYQSSQTDQLNYLTALGTGTTMPIKCSPDNITFNYVLHTNEQIISMTNDGTNFGMSFLSKANTLKQQIANSTSVEEIQAIKWSN